MELVVMVGLPGSGKTTEAERLAGDSDQWRVFSSDAYRKRLCGDENDQSRNAEIFQCLYKELNEALMSGYNCILDATNVSFKDRKRAFDSLWALRKCNACVTACVCAPPLEVVMKQDADRDRTVGEAVIRKYLHRFQFPNTFMEPFDKVYVVPHEARLPFALEKRRWLLRMYGVDQNNPHHTHTLLEHSLLISALAENSKIKEAGLWHDVGKLFTETRDASGVSHYYHHANVSSYLLASTGASQYLDEDEIFLVTYHMEGMEIRHNRDVHKQLQGAMSEYHRCLLDAFALYDEKASKGEF